ncbi:unnamed protein product (macronuclear) [Paramecium tetraurelia]|uniref:Chorein N-terminal domain-containing protein n=1 Tax=Paramecium tetraurelia TaxID=5888 RepID=A0E8Z3_PARTE|nr:uncharacterized protein GSPATT00024491001 [Paramecium tetraurelia]CAK91760.1 unnamed protein product [Paramecium tetraurelia]|eukprot:XP_001459157.1 hypothetical protein (macronuclear) [Paramecium tetraurelia strain d4-2]
MAKEIEEYFIKRLSSYLLEYLQDFSQNNMAKFSLGISSNIVLKNLSIKKQALLNFKFPLYIIDGKINSITLNMPLNYKKHQPELIIEGVELLVCTIQEINKFTQNKDYQQQGVENLKKHKLKLWEEQMAKYFEKLSPPNWIQKIVDGIFNNMSIIIKQFNVRFCNFSILGYETILRIKFDASIKATDSEFKQNFNNDLNSTFKLLQINKLSMSLKKEASYILSKKDVQMILMPIDIEIKYTLNKNYEQLTQPIMVLEALIKSPVIIQLNKEQKNYLIKLNEVLSCQEIIQDNFHLRPTKEIKNNYSDWWKYFINSIILKQKSQKLDLSFSSKKLVSMKRYIQLYKRKQNIVLVPWLSQWTAKDESKFKICEDNLPLKDLLKYREWAFQEIRMEAKRYCNSAKDGQNDQSVKPLLEIWTNTINNQNSFKDHTKRNDDIPIELEDDEKINLYEILERDKTNVLTSYLKGENNHPNQLKIDFKLKIHSIFFLIFEQRELNCVKYTPENTKIFKFCQCRYHLKLLKKQASSRKKVRQSSNVNTLTQVYNEMKQGEDKSFHSVNYIDSFYEDMEDLNGVESEISQQSNSLEKVNNQEQKQNADQPLHQKFVLLISFIGIRVPLHIYQNGGIQTPQPKQRELEEKIYIGDIKLIAPGILLKIMDEKEPRNLLQSPLFGKSPEEFLQEKKQSNQNSKSSIKYCEFFNEIFEISVTKDSQQFLNSEICYQMLGEFLKQNRMQNIKSFLDDYEKDKNGFQDFTTEQFKSYDKYFDDRPEIEDPLFIHIAKQQLPNEKSEKNEKNHWDFLRNVTINANEREKPNQWIICDNNNKHVFLQEAHNKIVDVIRRVLFIPFIEEFGEMILPTCISNLRDKLTFPQMQTKKEQDQQIYALQVSINFTGEHSEYRILRNNEVNKCNTKETNYQNKANPKSKIKIKITAFSFLLSTKAVTSLIYFMDHQKQQIFESPSYKQCKEDNKLLQCIVKSKPLAKETIKQQQWKFSLEMLDKFKIRIVTDSIASKIKTELKFQFKNLFIKTINLEKIRQNKDFKSFFTSVDKNKMDNFFEEQKYYSINKIILEQFQISHKYFSIDYRYYNEEMKNYEKQMQSQRSGKEQQGSPPLSFQRNNSEQLQRPIQFPLRHAVTSKNQQEDKQPNLQYSLQSKPVNKISGIKSIILESRFLLFSFDSLVENHPLITDKKLYIQIPYIDLQINDSQICFIELLMIINKKLKQKEKKRPQEFRYQMSKDSLMRAELLVLQNDHKKQKKDCKHCILRFRKSLSLSNIIFGSIPRIQNDINLFSLFEFENQMIYLRTQMKKIEEQQISKKHSQVTFVETHTNSGISISFKSTPKTSKSVCYVTVFEMPLFIITHDKGYFKDTIAIHCQKSKNDVEMSQSNKLEIPPPPPFSVEKSKSHYEGASLRPMPYRLPDEIDETNIEKTHIVFEPQLFVQESQILSDKLDDKFIFYCRNKELEMFNHDFAEYEEKDQQSQNNLIDQQSVKDPIYLLFYFHKPLRANLLLNVAEDIYQERHSKMKLFFAIENIKATFSNQFATYNVITILKNISTIMNIQENAFNLVNQDLLKKEKNKVKLKENPLKVIDDMIVCAIIQNIYLKSNETFFKLSQLRAFVQIYLMERQRFNPIQKRAIQSYYPQNISNIQIPKTRSSINNYEEDQILRCDTIKFNFNQVSQVDIKIVLVTKSKGELSLSVDDIQISIMGKQKENLLVMPGKDIGGQRAKYALHINLSFQNSYPLVKAKVEQAKILLSQQKVQDLLIAINSFYLINIEETISLKQHLLKYIFQQELNAFDREEKQVNIFVNQINNYKKAYKFASELIIESLIVKLQEQEKDFFLFQFHSIYLNKRNQTNLQLSIQQIEMKPQNSPGEKTVYQNLIEPIDSKQVVVFNIENKIISIRNMRFYLISRYINELQAFKQRVEAILQKNLDELKEKYQKDFDLQLQIKHEEDFLKEKDNFNYQIEITNSQFVLPETSQDYNVIIATFSRGQINLKKQKIQLKLPDIDNELTQQEQAMNESLFIDYREQIQPENGEFYVINMFGCFENVLVKYQLNNNQKTGELLKAEQITSNMDIPSFEQNCGQTQWTFKDQCKLEINKLKMSLDLGKLMKIKSLMTKNQEEQSPLFHFKRPLLQKINFEIKFSDSNLALTRFNQGEPEKLKQIKEKSKVYTQSTRKSKHFSPQHQQK